MGDFAYFCVFFWGGGGESGAVAVTFCLHTQSLCKDKISQLIRKNSAWATVILTIRQGRNPRWVMSRSSFKYNKNQMLFQP